MKMLFRVEWRRVFRLLTIYMSIAILIPVTIMIVIDVVKKGPQEAFRHLSPLRVLLLLVSIVVGSAVFSLLLSQLTRIGAVAIDREQFVGRNFWGLRRRIPLRDITRIYSYNHSGLDFVVVASKTHGEVHILRQTENLDQLLELLSTYLPPEDKEPPTLRH